MFSECALNVPPMGKCSMNVHSVLLEYALIVARVCTQRSLNGHSTFLEYTINFHFMRTQCFSMNVHSLFAEWELSVP
jgi:hypothetical protein